MISLTWKPDNDLRADMRALLERLKLKPEDATALKELALRIGCRAFDDGCTVATLLHSVGVNLTTEQPAENPEVALPSEVTPTPAPAEGLTVALPADIDDIPF